MHALNLLEYRFECGRWVGLSRASDDIFRAAVSDERHPLKTMAPDRAAALPKRGDVPVNVSSKNCSPHYQGTLPC